MGGWRDELKIALGFVFGFGLASRRPKIHDGREKNVEADSSNSEFIQQFSPAALATASAAGLRVRTGGCGEGIHRPAVRWLEGSPTAAQTFPGCEIRPLPENLAIALLQQRT